jgi:hypothetical protein
VGDTSYLLAEVTPFGFSWRCDVLGNVQGFIANVLDVDRARTAFKFMWGVGVNEPYPVVNLYPPVQAGDPDWRSYYTVNLLNLPGPLPQRRHLAVHRRHVGAVHPPARPLRSRLPRTAEARPAQPPGKNQEWEFNEWIHSRTGRPMGKCFQAWSASSYIHACQELQINPDP